MDGPSSPESDLIVSKQHSNPQYDAFQNSLINQLAKAGKSKNPNLIRDLNHINILLSRLKRISWCCSRSGYNII
jgi:hypothetical protein